MPAVSMLCAYALMFGIVVYTLLTLIREKQRFADLASDYEVRGEALQASRAEFRDALEFFEQRIAELEQAKAEPARTKCGGCVDRDAEAAALRNHLHHARQRVTELEQAHDKIQGRLREIEVAAYQAKHGIASDFDCMGVRWVPHKRLEAAPPPEGTNAYQGHSISLPAGFEQCRTCGLCRTHVVNGECVDCRH